eukprot:1891647-Prymnesium_polylepis.1
MPIRAISSRGLAPVGWPTRRTRRFSGRLPRRSIASTASARAVWRPSSTRRWGPTTSGAMPGGSTTNAAGAASSTGSRRLPRPRAHPTARPTS